MTKYNLPNDNSTDNNLTDEYAEYDRLYKLKPRTANGDVEFVSDSSESTYDTSTFNAGIYSNRGEEGMLLVLKDVLTNYIVFAEDINDITDDISTTNDNIGDLAALPTTDQSSIVNSITEVNTEINSDITQINTDLAFLVPQGGIIMWSGAIGDIPSGWNLCDGTNGTPNLMDKFIVGAGSTYSVTNEGGENTHVLSEAEMPSHTHVTDEDGSHTHSFTREFGGIYDSSYEVVTDDGNLQADTFDTVPQTDSAGEHTHNVLATGSDTAHENRPPYFALAYIMKL